MEVLKIIDSDDIYHKALINTLQSEIDELRIQLTYHKNYIADFLMYGCFTDCRNCKK